VANNCSMHVSPKVDSRLKCVSSYVHDWSALPPSQVAPPFERRVADASVLRQRAGAAPWTRSVALAQISVTEMGTELCSIFWGRPVMRKVGESLSKRALTPVWLCAARAHVARAPVAAWRAC